MGNNNNNDELPCLAEILSPSPALRLLEKDEQSQIVVVLRGKDRKNRYTKNAKTKLLTVYSQGSMEKDSSWAYRIQCVPVTPCDHHGQEY